MNYNRYTGWLFALCFLFSFNGFTVAQSLDLRLLDKVNHPSARYDKLWHGFSNSAMPVTAITPLACFSYGYLKPDAYTRKNAVYQAEALALNALLTFGLKWSVRRERPYVNHALIYRKDKTGPFSFPSGHTSVAFATATNLTLAYPKWYVALPAYTWAGAVGYSRMHLGVHYPSDVLAGALIGTLSSVVMFKLNRHFAGK